MTLGHAPTQPDIFRSSAAYCDDRVPAHSIYALLHRERHRLFPDAGWRGGSSTKAWPHVACARPSRRTGLGGSRRGELRG